MEYLVFDVGGTAIKYALMNDELEMLEREVYLHHLTH